MVYKFTKRIIVSVTEDTAKKLDEAHKEYGDTFSAFMREVIREYLKNHKKK